MAAELDSWSGTLMLIGQPAEEWKISGAQAMHQDRLWERFGQPDYALAFHVAADIEAGKLHVAETSVLWRQRYSYRGWRNVRAGVEVCVRI